MRRLVLVTAIGALLAVSGGPAFADDFCVSWYAKAGDKRMGGTVCVPW